MASGRWRKVCLELYQKIINGEIWTILLGEKKKSKLDTPHGVKVTVVSIHYFMKVGWNTNQISKLAEIANLLIRNKYLRISEFFFEINSSNL